MKKPLSTPIYVYAATTLVAMMTIASIALSLAQPGLGSKQDLNSISNVHLVAATPTTPLVAGATDVTTGTAVLPLASVEDVKRILVYPGAIVTRNEVTIGTSTLRYLVPDDIDVFTDLRKVNEFFNTALSQKEWKLFSSSTDRLFGDYWGSNAWNDRTYLWTEREDSLWNLVVSITLDPSAVGGTLVDIRYYRMPDVQSYLRDYPGAQQIEQREGEGSYNVGKIYNDQILVPAHIITKTFVTRTSVNEIEHYYNSTMFNYGWAVWDIDPKEGPILIVTPKGSLSSEEGLSFTGDPLYITQGNSQRTQLLITASPTGDGLTRVQLQAFILQYPPPK